MPAEAMTPARFEASYARLLKRRGATPGPALERGLAVHRNNAAVAALAALEDNFPVLAAMLGQDPFVQLALHHGVRHPPRDPRLSHYGAHLCDTITAADDLAAWPWLADIARLEWLVVAALFAADAPQRRCRLQPDRPWPLAPATRWLVSVHPVASLWQAHQPGATWPDDFPAAGELALVTRPAGKVVVTALPIAAAPLLTALHCQTVLADLASEDLGFLPALAAAGALVPAVGDK